ncbi:hypothetical protein [Halovenus marina]|uniref:hypothetical protein n=1 Tax=Halovenus marina TaxID=3396621 RepID=UPI003F558A90
MVDVVPVGLLVFGLIAMFRPAWIAVIDRRQNAAETTRRPDEIEMSEAYFGIAFILFGLIFTLRSL